MSGGVDSSYCVHLLQRAGYRVEGLVIEFSPLHRAAVEAAARAADFLRIPLHTVRCHAMFEEAVIEPFCQAYRSGRTPNPCILCNPRVKFHILREEADRRGIPLIATGHYAGVLKQHGRYLLRRSRSIARDQSYMLYRLTQHQLEGLLLPLETLAKDVIRADAAALGIPGADAPDSQEICFLEGSYAGFIEARYSPSPAGRFIGPDGRVVGQHRGILHYTVGQRKHLGIALGRPVFIRSIDPVTGDIRLADAGDDRTGGIFLDDCVYLPFEAPDGPFRAQVKIRSMAAPLPASILPRPDGRAEVRFDQPVRAPAPGQSAVFYQEDRVIGGGFIDRWAE